MVAAGSLSLWPGMTSRIYFRGSGSSGSSGTLCSIFIIYVTVPSVSSSSSSSGYVVYRGGLIIILTVPREYVVDGKV